MLLKHHDEQPRGASIESWTKNRIVFYCSDCERYCDFGVPLLPPATRIYRLAVLYRHVEPQLVIASNAMHGVVS